MAAGEDDLQEALLQFLYLMPVGVVKFGADGAVDLMNPAASSLLQTLAGTADLANLFDALHDLVPDLRGQMADFPEAAGAILDQARLEARIGGRSLAGPRIGVNRL